ncbi:MAG: replicative DNA helicase [Bacteroidetes bacterium]|nr:MAG: replicative DNA helicase [Bacteroidota bacterium]
MAKQSQPQKKRASVALDYGKIPPQAPDLEEAVLGAIMLEKDAILTVIDILEGDSFYKEAHQHIYNVALSLSQQEKPVDLLTVTEELRKTDKLDIVGGASYIAQLTSRVGSAAHLEYHARIVAQKYIQRELIRVSSEIQERAFDESSDVDDLLDFSERELLNIAEGHIKKETQPMNVLVRAAIDQIQEAGKNDGALSGVPSGFTRLDRMTSGWQRSDLIIVAARPSMGKTAFVLSMARNMAVDHSRPVAIFSLEMSSIQLVNRLIIGETQLSAEKVRNGQLENYEWEQLEYKIKDLEKAPIYVDDTPGISIFEFRAKCRRLKQKFDVQAIVIDYLQLMSGSKDSGSREQEVSQISRSLKSVAKELDVPIIALSQLNRSVEMRSGNKRPQLSDLRESGAIEQDADLVCFIHRPEYYGMEIDEEGNSLKGIAEIIVAKHRNGAIGDVQLKFIREFAKFVNLDDTLGMMDPDGNGNALATFQSSMNNDQGVSNDDIAMNAGFDEPAPF